MAPRSIWNGTITFGLVNVPVKLYSATESKTRPLPRGPPRATARAIEHRRVCSEGGQGGPLRARSSRATRSPRASTSCSSKDEIKAAAGDRGKVIDVEDFVDAERDRPGLLRQDLLPRRARRRRGRLPAAARGARARPAGPAIGRFTFHDREYLVAVRALDDVLALHTLRFHDEVVDGRRPRHARAAAQAAEQARDRDGGQARRRRSHAEFEPERLRGQLPRGGARPDQAQGARARRSTCPRRRSPSTATT